MTHLSTRVVVDAPYRSDTVASAEPIIGWITETDAADWRQARAELAARPRRRASSRTSSRAGRRRRSRGRSRRSSPREEVTLRVRVTGEDGGQGAWSEPRRIFAGFLGDGEWTRDDDRPRRTRRGRRSPRYLRTEFDVASRRGARHPLRDGRRRLPGRAQRRGRRRPGHEARLDARSSTARSTRRRMSRRLVRDGRNAHRRAAGGRVGAPSGSASARTPT